MKQLIRKRPLTNKRAKGVRKEVGEGAGSHFLSETKTFVIFKNLNLPSEAKKFFLDKKQTRNFN
jgi:hypothetical protein